MFYAEGLKVGVDTIIAAAGVAKASFYKHFPTKDDLIVDFLIRRDTLWREWLAATVDSLTADPAEKPLAVFDALAQRFRLQDFRGCAFINTMVEVANDQHAAHLAAARHKHAVIEYLSGLLDAAGFTDTKSLASVLMLLIDGATVTAVREGSPESAMMARRTAALLLETSPKTKIKEN